MLDFIEFDDGFAIAKVRAPADIAGQTLADAALRTRYGITVVGVKTRAARTSPTPGPRPSYRPGALLIVAGRTDQIQRFAAVT